MTSQMLFKIFLTTHNLKLNSVQPSKMQLLSPFIQCAKSISNLVFKRTGDLLQKGFLL